MSGGDGRAVKLAEAMLSAVSTERAGSPTLEVAILLARPASAIFY